MLFSVEQSELKDALAIANIGVGSEKGSFATKLKFEVGPDEVRIKATDKNKFVFVPLEPEDVDKQESFLIDADRLKKWASNVPSGVVEVERDGSDIVMTRGRVVGRFVWYDPANFPELENKTEQAEEVLDVSCGRLRTAFKFSKPFLGEVSDGTSTQAWKQVSEMWDGDMVSSDIRSVNCFSDPLLAAAPVELSEDQVSAVKAMFDQLNANGDYFLEFDEVVFEGEEGFVAKRNRLGKLLADTSGRDDLPGLREEYKNGGLDPFRISKKVLGTLLKFLRKTSGVGVKVERKDQMYVVRADDGSLFGFNRSQHEMPFIMGVMYEEPNEDHRWKMSPESILSAVKALLATAPKNADNLLIELDGDVLNLRMASASNDGDGSVYPIDIECIAGCEDVAVEVGHGRLSDVVGQYDGEDIEFGLNPAEQYMKVVDYPEDPEEEDPDPEPLKYSQISLART